MVSVKAWLFSSFVVVSLALTGCGFHLQNAFSLPAGVDRIYVDYSNPRSAEIPPVVQALRHKLRQVDALGEPSAAATIKVNRAGLTRTLISISPIDGSAAEYELEAEVSYSYKENGVTRIAGDTLKITRYYSYSEASRLASQAESEELSKQIQTEIAQRILFKINQLKPLEP